MQGLQVQFHIRSVFARVGIRPIRSVVRGAAASPLLVGTHSCNFNFNRGVRSIAASDNVRRCKRALSSSSSSSSSTTDGVQQMSVQTLHSILNDASEREKYEIVDVREAAELELSKLHDDKVVHLPMSQARQWAELISEGDTDVLDVEKSIVCLCHHGVRSQNVAMFLKQLGVKQVYNLSGGIDAYSRNADPSVPQY